MSELPPWLNNHSTNTRPSQQPRPARGAHTRPTKPGIRLTRAGWIVVTYVLALTFWCATAAIVWIWMESR
jgi:hypothetical protein